jgi:hypothetical protein
MKITNSSEGSIKSKSEEVLKAGECHTDKLSRLQIAYT